MLAKKLAGAAFLQEARVIVDVFREQARSYKRRFKGLLYATKFAGQFNRHLAAVGAGY